jgi:uncharacterized membrane protein YeaQ/YmgE (transglycosylase-associated protein family)
MRSQINYSPGFQKDGSHVLDRERIITIMIVIGIFGGLVGGPILSLADYYAPPDRRFWIFIIPEFIGFGCLVLMVIWGKSKKGKKKYQPEGDDNS